MNDLSRQHEESFRALFETMAQGVVYQDREGHILTANAAAERILGLTTVFGIVKQNQGHIRVYSEANLGTTFKIYLPRCKTERNTETTATVHRSLHGTETVLLVEDEEQVLKLGRRILEQHGYTVLTSATALAAQKVAAQYPNPIHLLIADVIMPGMNGKELMERLRSRNPRLRCLFMSGYRADVMAHHGVLDAGVQFIEKPFSIQTLTGKLRDVLEQPPSEHTTVS
ncbi:MAG TPA: response regulator [Candidatus Paceibacterota bacterium]|nr:response regulator [Verrucomicrobiota bacterium]HRY51878.1 response regulator [Candidatus Paceibacterota bacterium]HSA02602.1 response regulator [Candidatus Paceibacterota bacterium]